MVLISIVAVSWLLHLIVDKYQITVFTDSQFTTEIAAYLSVGRNFIFLASWFMRVDGIALSGLK